ncbi:MAG: DUF92 domain-containing protein [Eubacteriales bacterium]|nr:DUF92 domain-containing protein [Eubacteriales bacterium]
MGAFEFFGITGNLLAGAVLLVSFIVSFLAWKRRSLTGAAAIVAAVFAVVYYLTGGLKMVFLLLLFFLSSTLLTHYKKHDKHSIEKDLHEKKGARDTFQVIANGGPALLMSLLSVLFQSNLFYKEMFQLAAAGALAASNADTWASEIGVLSHKRPVYILSRKPVQTGLSGGVTRLGTLAALAGGVFIALVFGFLAVIEALTTFAAINWLILAMYVLLIAVTGFLGSIIDSILGETLQAKYIHYQHAHLTEKAHEHGIANILKKGWRWMTNDWVNLISSMSAATILLTTLILI